MNGGKQRETETVNAQDADVMKQTKTLALAHEMPNHREMRTQNIG